MTMIEIRLPDDLAQRAENAGLLSDDAIQHLLEDAIRRKAGRALLDISKRIQTAGIPVMSDEDIMVEVKAVRAERRAREAAKTLAAGDDAGRS